MYCLKCGNKLSDTDKFCINCGKPVEKKTGDLERPNEPVNTPGQKPSVTPDRVTPEKSPEEKPDIPKVGPEISIPIEPKGPNPSVTPDRENPEKSPEEKPNILERPSEPDKTPGLVQSQHIRKKKSKGLIISVVIIIVILGLGIGSFYIYKLNTGINSKDYCISKLCRGCWVSDSSDKIQTELFGYVDELKQQRWFFHKDFTFNLTEKTNIKSPVVNSWSDLSNGGKDSIYNNKYKGTWSLSDVIQKDNNSIRLINCKFNLKDSIGMVPQLTDGNYTPFEFSELDNDKDELTIPVNFNDGHTGNFTYYQELKDTIQQILTEPTTNNGINKNIDTTHKSNDTTQPHKDTTKINVVDTTSKSNKDTLNN